MAPVHANRHSGRPLSPLAFSTPSSLSSLSSLSLSSPFSASESLLMSVPQTPAMPLFQTPRTPKSPSKFTGKVFTPSVSARQMAELMADGTRPTLATLTQLAANGSPSRRVQSPSMHSFRLASPTPPQPHRSQANLTRKDSQGSPAIQSVTTVTEVIEEIQGAPATPRAQTTITKTVTRTVTRTVTKIKARPDPVGSPPVSPTPIHHRRGPFSPHLSPTCLYTGVPTSPARVFTEAPATPSRVSTKVRAAPWPSPAEYEGVYSAPTRGPLPTKIKEAGKATEYDRVVQEREDGIIGEDEDVAKYRGSEDVGGAGNTTPIYYIPNPEEILPMPPATGRKKYYVVTVGQDVGVFNDWGLVQALTSGVSGASQHGCKTFQEAIDIYSKAFNENRIKVLPIRGDIFDNPIVFDDVNSVGEFIDTEGCKRQLPL